MLQANSTASGRLAASAITVADGEVILDDLAERHERQHVRDHRRAVGEADVKHQPVAAHAQMQSVRPAVVPDGPELIIFDQIVDRDAALVLDVVGGAAERSLIERHGGEPALLLLILAGRARHRRLAIEPDGDRAGMGLEPFRGAERNGRAAERAQLLGAAFEDRGALHEIEHAEA